VLPPRNLDPESLCLCDLPMVARGARRIAVLAEVGLEDFLAATALLESLRTSLPQAAIRVVCPPDLAPLLAGYDLQTFDRELFLRDDAAMHAQLDALRNYAPDLLVNLSRQRGVIGDLLADAAGAAGALAFDDETAENRDDPARLLRGRAYRRLLPADAPYPAMAAALGLQPGPERLWPDQASRDQARAALAEAGWEPGRTLALLGDDPAALAGAGAEALAKAVQAGWRVLALGGPATRALLGQALEPFGARACNLAGALSLAGMAAFLQHCGACLGGSPAFQALARAAGCRVLDQAG
jgi:ADP-heptose:LPS heptosyltransferase